MAVPVSSDGRTLLVRRPENGLLGGLWEFPSVQVPEGSPAEAEGATLATLAGEAAEARGLGLGDGAPRSLGSIRHAFTHLRMTYELFLFPGAVLDGAAREGTGGDGAGGGEEAEGGGEAEPTRVVSLTELDSLPLPAAQQEIGRRAVEWFDGTGDRRDGGE